MQYLFAKFAISWKVCNICKKNMQYLVNAPKHQVVKYAISCKLRNIHREKSIWVICFCQRAIYKICNILRTAQYQFFNYTIKLPGNFFKLNCLKRGLNLSNCRDMFLTFRIVVSFIHFRSSMFSFLIAFISLHLNSN